ncbi:MAG: bifunctional 5,10-methylenetetrahydrofolate dehydrogenase/5,10-methenyltetrahydrofolate cyclohydrolase [Candidatus Omnitrophota bacterium]|nr:MAG: bifunctional 5,10-methylenetetrahydrofolate dehydrogenase/5,10-methenyltetrahydrofolate cyclohydrolase [Candidatus Omnitrophota bacterium]
MATILNSQDSYNVLEQELKRKLKFFPPLHLASVAIGEEYSTEVYRSSQLKVAERLGVEYRPVSLKRYISFKGFVAEIKKINDNRNVTGIIVNKPFPWPEEEVFSLIDEAKDVEGVHPVNLGKLCISSKTIADVGKDLFIPPTVRSILHVLSLSDLENVYGKRVTIVGFSSLVGRPLALLLANAFATVSITHIATSQKGDLPGYVERADILISAVGKPHLIKGDWIKEGAVIIDVGVGKKDGKICGDVELQAAKKRASFISPVPGGVGKLTPLFLFDNLIKAAQRGQKLKSR